jgi:aquaporin NIP
VTVPLGSRLLAEGAGTALLVGIGTGAIVAAARAGGVPQVVLAVAWFAAVALPIYLFARVSGSHLNPAVTLALSAAGRFPRRDVLPYALAQCAGAFAASAIVWGVLGSAAHLGATLPAGGDLGRTFVLEALFTFLLLLSVLWLTTPGKVVRWWELLAPPAVVGLSTFLIGPLTGSSLNPARTLAPAVLSGAVDGWWVYFLAVPLGALAAVAVVERWPRSARIDRVPS